MFRAIHRISRRQLHNLHVSEEVRAAISSKNPVVALESTIITHGLPYPQNVEMALHVESLIRDKGATPASIAFLQGRPHVGLVAKDIEFLAENSKDAVKVSRRDIAHIMSHKLNGGTTIAGTMILAQKAGIKVFGTGGLGGVHKGAESTFDVSADLTELGRTNVAVVCAGPKSILDVAKTVEYLETQGCFVATKGSKGTNIPGFFTPDSGVKSPYNFNTFREAAQIVHAGNQFGIDSGYLFCIPPPESVSLDSSYIAQIIKEAELEAHHLGIFGKELTPFLLGKIAELTGGNSVKTNLQVVYNNVAAATEIAIELAKIENGEIAPEQESHFEPEISPVIPKPSDHSATVSIPSKASSGAQKTALVVGSVAMDVACKFHNAYHSGDSNPGTSSTSLGGVGLNVALAAKLASKDRHKTTFFTAVGKDATGKLVANELSSKGLACEIIENSQFPTAKYVSVHDMNGNLLIACADMDIAENFDNKLLSRTLAESQPDIVLADGNLGVETYKAIEKSGVQTVFEPTSAPKAAKLAHVVLEDPEKHALVASGKFAKLLTKDYSSLRGFVLATPTVAELRTIHDEMEKLELFDVDYWFPVMDKFGINANFRDLIQEVSQKFSFVNQLVRTGVFQQAFKLLPFVPAVAVKLGKEGVLLFTLGSTRAAQKKITRNSFTLSSDGEGCSVTVQMFPGKEVNVNNVTGAGDSFVGCLLSEICLRGTSVLFEVGDARDAVIERAQAAARLSLASQSAISDKIADL